MKAHPLVLILTMVVCGCYMPPPEGLRADVQPGAGGVRAGRGSARTDAIVPTIGNPISIAGTSYLAFPFAVQVNDEGKSKIGLVGSSIGSDVEFYAPSYVENPGIDAKQGGAHGWVGGTVRHWNNVFFRNEQTGEARILFDKKVVITAAYFPQSLDKPRDELLFAAAKADTNKDKYINASDAVVLYHATPDGKKLTPVTPTVGSQFRDFEVDDSGRILYVRTRKDTNGDGAFTAADETVLLRVDLNAPAEGMPLVPADLMKRAFEIVTPGK